MDNKREEQIKITRGLNIYVIKKNIRRPKTSEKNIINLFCRVQFERQHVIINL